MPTVTIGDNTADDYSGIQDTGIFSESVENNYGARTTMDVGIYDTITHKYLIRPDLSNIPAGSTCNSASLFIYDTDAYGDRDNDLILTAYRIADANSDWVEGTQNGASEAGSPCWSYKAYDPVTPTNWAGSAGMATAGTDYINTSLGAATFTDGASGYVEIVLNASGLAILEDWFGQASPPGILLLPSGISINMSRVVSSEGTDGNRPYLEVNYDEPSNKGFFF